MTKKSAKNKPSDTMKIDLPLGGRSYPITRGLCLFFGLFSLLNVISCLIGDGTNQNTWWIDLSALTITLDNGDTFHLGFILELLTAIANISWALRPSSFLPRRIINCVLVGCMAVFALANAINYWITLSSGVLYSASPIPLSFVLAIIFVVICLRIAWAKPRKNRKVSGMFLTVTVAVIAALAFPLLQTAFFGTTDYRRDADAAVVFGARVYEDGTLSAALRERMETAVELYEDGYVSKLIVSGGIEGGGVDEAQAMYKFAVEHGVPADDLLIDRYGDSTEHSVDNTIKLMGAYDINSIIATSSFYHMPRIKMLFNLKSVDVLTVPTIGNIAGNGTLASIWREIPAWWYYWIMGSF